MSTVKLRQADFTKVVDTEVSFRNALQSLVDHKLLPPAWKQPGAQLATASYSEGRE